MTTYKSKSGLIYKQVGKNGNDLVFASKDINEQVCIYSENEIKEMIETGYWRAK